jgi:hypothetical protein
VTKLAQELIEARLKYFWGYGRLQAPTWLIGIEEGLVKEERDLSPRFRATDKRAPIDAANGKGWIDVCSDMQGVEHHIKWYRPDARIQTTLRYPIALYLFMQNRVEPSDQEILHYQTHRIGKNEENPEIALLELLPLPVRGIDEGSWIYGGSGIDGLESRAAYERKYLGQRVSTLLGFLNRFRPKLIVFYSLTYFRRHLQDRLPVRFEAIPIPPDGEGLFGQVNGTSICVIPQGQRSGHISMPKLVAYAGQAYSRIHGLGATATPEIGLAPLASPA